MSSRIAWPPVSAESRWLLSTSTNSTTPMTYVCKLPAVGTSIEIVNETNTIGAASQQQPSRRQRLQNRMPPRNDIQKLIDRRRAERDPWLDDEHD